MIETIPTIQTQNDIAEALENAAARLEADRVAREAISTRRGRMMRGEGDGGSYDASEAFYAALAIRLKLEAADPASGVTTMATDGERLLYHPQWVAGLDHSRKGELHGVIVHEAVHCAHAHHARMPAECRTDPQAMRDCNVAADLAINGTLKQAGFTLPGDGCFPGEGRFANMPPDLSMEQYYALIREQRQENPEGSAGSDDGTPGPGDILPPADPQKARQQASTWKLAVAQAEQYAQSRGDLSAGLRRLIDGILRPAYDMEDVLREYMTRVNHDRANWNVRNRRYADVYLPGKLDHALGEIVLVLDCSGSISPAVLQRACEIAQQAIEANPARLTVLCHDTDVTNAQTWEKDDPQLAIEPKGGGGTSHVAVFENIRRDSPTADLVMCLTDCESRYPKQGPECDVVWARFGGGGTVPPFGKVVDVAV